MEHKLSEPPEHILTLEELGNTWAYCYGQVDTILLPTDVKDDKG